MCIRDSIMINAQPLQVTGVESGIQRYAFPDLDSRFGSDSSWTTTLDTLRSPPRDQPRDYRWRRESPVRPIVFEAPETVDEDSVQLHLEHRIVRRLLGRFMSQGFVYHDLSRA